MLQVWGRRSAFNVQKVMWLIGELNLQHEHIPAGGSFGVRDTSEFLAMNPHGRIPVVKDGGTVVWESHTILRYLAAVYGGPATTYLYPPNSNVCRQPRARPGYSHIEAARSLGLVDRVNQLQQERGGVTPTSKA